MFSMGITMLIFALLMGKIKIEPSVFPSFMLSMRYIFIVFAILCFLGIFASAGRGRIRQT
jgi:hypothetical protein